MSITPETDNLARGNHVVPTEWAQDLEIERDAWRQSAKAFYEYFQKDDIRDLDQALTIMSWIEDDNE
jgi:hypothetical protein